MSRDVLAWAIYWEGFLMAPIPTVQEVGALAVLNSTRAFVRNHIDWQRGVLA